jgi:hypothetical protein
MSAAVLLCEPKFAHNVGNALRACALLGAGRLSWSGTRVPAPEDWESRALPREERMKCYAKTQLRHVGNDVSLEMLEPGYAPVCVEIREGAEDLRDFVHPEMPCTCSGPRTAM